MCTQRLYKFPIRHFFFTILSLEVLEETFIVTTTWILFNRELYSSHILHYNIPKLKMLERFLNSTQGPQYIFDRTHITSYRNSEELYLCFVLRYYCLFWVNSYLTINDFGQPISWNTRAKTVAHTWHPVVPHRWYDCCILLILALK